MKKTNFLTTVVVMMLVMFATSCSHLYYQVYNTKAVDGKQLTNAENYSYETADYVINYALWGLNGNPGFEIINKSDKFVDINLNKSFFIRNGFAYDYVVEENGLYRVSSECKPYMTIPPHSKKVFTRFEINKEIFQDCDLEIKPRKSESVAYTQDNSPLTFGNVITIQVGDKAPEILSHKFYVSRITNYRDKFFNLYGPSLPSADGGVQGINSMSVSMFKRACKTKTSVKSSGEKSVSVPSSCFYTTYRL